MRATLFAPIAMPTRINVPEASGIPATVVTLFVTIEPFKEAGELYYLHVIRQNPSALSGTLMSARCQLYLDHVSEIAAQLVTAAGVQNCDAMVGVPTRREELLRPYLDAARSLHPGIVDLTSLVRRDPEAGSTSGLSFAERQARHTLTGPLPAIRRLLILDDFIASGESAAQVIEIVRQHTPALPEIIIAAPLWVPPKEQTGSYIEGIVEARLRSVIGRAEAEVLMSDTRYRHLYDEGLTTRPIFCFGNVSVSKYLTIGANPSADDFRAGRWGVGDLASQSFTYFNRVLPHDFFANWGSALMPLLSQERYSNGNLAHLDVSPRATKSLRAINQLGDPFIDDFLKMARGDAGYLFLMLATVWPQVRGLFAAGTITKRKYVDEFLAEMGRPYGFQFRSKKEFPGRAKTPGVCSKMYDVRFAGRSVPLFFCHVGASADKPGDQEYFKAQIKDNADYLRSVFLKY